MKTKSISRRNQRRASNYKRLTEAGFTGVEANKYKDRSSKVVSELIATRKAQQKHIESILGGTYEKDAKKG